MSWPLWPNSLNQLRPPVLHIPSKQHCKQYSAIWISIICSALRSGRRKVIGTRGHMARFRKQAETEPYALLSHAQRLLPWNRYNDRPKNAAYLMMHVERNPRPNTAPPCKWPHIHCLSGVKRYIAGTRRQTPPVKKRTEKKYRWDKHISCVCCCFY